MSARTTTAAGVILAALVLGAAPATAVASQPGTTGPERTPQSAGTDDRGAVADEVDDAFAAQAEQLPDALLRGESLAAGEALVSPSGRYALVLTEDGSLVLADAPNRLNPEPVVLAVLAEGGEGATLVMQTDGNLVLYTATGGVAQNFGTDGTAADRLAIQDDRNVVLYGGGRVWVNFDTVVFSTLQVGEVLLPGDRLASEDGGTVLVMQTDGNLVGYQGGRVVFQSRTVRYPGAAAVMQGDGNFVVYSTMNVPVFNTRTTNAAVEENLLLVDVGGFQVLSGAQEPTALYGSAWFDRSVTPGQVLLRGDMRRSDYDARSVLRFQADGNIVQYVDGRPVWQTRTDGTGANLAVMQTDGNFVVYVVKAGQPTRFVFQTGTSGSPGASLTLPPLSRSVQVLSRVGAVLYPR